MNEEDWVELLREAHQEPIAPAHYAAVRARVLAELRRERRPVWRWGWVWGLAAVVVAVAVMVFPRPVPVGGTGVPTDVAGPSAFLEFPVYGPAAPVVEENRPVPVRRTHRVVVQAKQEAKQEANQEGRPGGPPHVVIKLLTDDPNVVIYWIGE